MRGIIFKEIEKSLKDVAREVKQQQQQKKNTQVRRLLKEEWCNFLCANLTP